MTQDSTRLISKSAVRFSIGTFLSRLSGMVREVTMASVLGTTPSVAAFLVAFRFAYLLRRLFGESALINGFIPHYQALRTENEENALKFFRDLFGTSTILLIGLIGILELGLLTCLICNPMQETTAEILRLIMLSLPGLLFISLFALHAGFLQCHGRFFLTGIAPLAFNVAWIGTLIFYRHHPPSAITTRLALALDVAFLFQWAILLPTTWQQMRKFFVQSDSTQVRWLPIRLFSGEIRRMLTTISLGILGVGAAQINSFIDLLFARTAELAGPAYLSFAIRLQQFPLALFGIAISSALFPSLSKAIKNQDELLAYKLVDFGAKKTVILMTLCTVGIFSVGIPSVNLLFGHGQFNDFAVMKTVLCLWAYGLGLLPTALAIFFNQAFFARHDFRTPTFMACGIIVLNATCNSILIFGCQFGATSVALSTSFSALVHTGTLQFIYRKRYGLSYMHRTTILTLLIISASIGILSLMVAEWAGNPAPFSLLRESTPPLFSHILIEQIWACLLPGITFLTLALLSWLALEHRFQKTNNPS